MYIRSVLIQKQEVTYLKKQKQSTSVKKPRSGKQNAVNLAKSILEDSYFGMNGNAERQCQDLAKYIIEERKQYLKTGVW